MEIPEGLWVGKVHIAEELLTADRSARAKPT
jgi:hypothetical protein